MKRLILGDGLLGSFLYKETNWYYISRKKDNIDFSNIETYKKYLYDYDEIINCIANTDTYSNDKELHWNINYKGVADLVDFCSNNNKKLIHISTDYLYTFSDENSSEKDVPVHCNTWYGYTKLLADGYVQLKSNNYLIIRGTQKSEPFKYEFAFTNQIGNFDYVSVIGGLIIDLIKNNAKGIFNVGTEIKSMYELALKTKDDVKPTSTLFNVNMPTNVTMNVNKMKNFLDENINNTGSR